MSSERFEAIEDDLTSLIDNLKSKITENIPGYFGEEKKAAIRHAERRLEEARFMVQDMEEHAKQAPVGYKSQMVGKVRNYRRSVEDLEKLLHKGQSGGASSRDRSDFDRNDRIESSQRSRVIQGTDSLNRTSESIARSQRVAAETDEIGVEIIDELGNQRESLVRTRDRLHDTDAELGRSRRILKSMAIRLATSKLILMLIIIIELATVGGLVYWKFFS